MDMDQNMTDITSLITVGLILCFSVLYLIRSNNTTNIDNQNINNQNIDTIIDNNSETDTDVDTQFDNESLSDSATSSVWEGILEDPEVFFLPSSILKIINDKKEFIMPDVDFNVCPIEELKLFELCSLFSRELAEHAVSEEELMELICLFSKADLATNWVNDVILFIINLL